MESTRLPGKPLKMIAGRTLIERSWHRAVKAFGPHPGSSVVVATDSRQIARAARRFGADVVMTSAHHGCGTERVEEAAALLRAGPGDVIVNFQGDEPFADAPAVLRAAERVGKQLERSPDPAKELIVATVAAPLRDEEERWSPSLVKVWPGREGRAARFSRTPKGDAREMRHVGIYAYSRAALRKWVSAPPSAAEQAANLEQLRAMEAGIPVYVEAGPWTPPGVDLPEDLARAEAHLALSSVPGQAFGGTLRQDRQETLTGGRG